MNNLCIYVYRYITQACGTRQQRSCGRSKLRDVLTEAREAVHTFGKRKRLSIAEARKHHRYSFREQRKELYGTSKAKKI